MRAGGGRLRESPPWLRPLGQHPRRRVHRASALPTGVSLLQSRWHILDANPSSVMVDRFLPLCGLSLCFRTVSSEARSIYRLVTVLLASILGIHASGKVMETPAGPQRREEEHLVVNPPGRQAGGAPVWKSEPRVEWAGRAEGHFTSVPFLPTPEPGAQGLRETTDSPHSGTRSLTTLLRPRGLKNREA